MRITVSGTLMSGHFDVEWLLPIQGSAVAYQFGGCTKLLDVKSVDDWLDDATKIFEILANFNDMSFPLLAQSTKIKKVEADVASIKF